MTEEITFPAYVQLPLEDSGKSWREMIRDLDTLSKPIGECTPAELETGARFAEEEAALHLERAHDYREFAKRTFGKSAPE